ncbi:MAG TPA: LysR family transcriptional regulator [Terriglobales bacterium]|nr:LysR family transcriptional regulator [Terriglobales bacterium]
MQFRGLDLNLLVVLDALLTEQNTTRAGEVVCLGQSATSAALSRLREFFGDELLVRSGQKMVLTPLAQELVDPVRRVLRETESIANYNLRFDPRTSSRVFKLNMSDYVTLSLLPALMKRIKKVAANVRIETRHYTGGTVQVTNSPPGNELRSYLEQGDVDFLVVLKDFLSPLHPSEELFRDHYVGVVWSGNRLVKKQLLVEQFFSMSHAVVRIGPHQTLTQEEIAIQHTGRERRIELILSNFSLVPGVLLGTDLIAVMHGQLAKLYQKFMPLRLLQLPFPMPEIDMHLQWHRYHDHDPGTLWFRDFMKQAAKDVFRSQTKSEVKENETLLARQ